MIELSVNLNKIALLRNSRGGDQPSVVEAAEIAVGAGAYGITVHPRPDMRHVRPHDVMDLARLLRERHPGIELNIEGNPFAPALANGYPGFDALIESARPDQCTLVPDSDSQLTSDHGWDLTGDTARLEHAIARYRKLGARVSLFLDPDPVQVERAARVGTQRIELYTGPFAESVRTYGVGSTQAQASLRSYADGGAAGDRTRPRRQRRTRSRPRQSAVVSRDHRSARSIDWSRIDRGRAADRARRRGQPRICSALRR